MCWCGKMRGKKAWIRILEAFIAILLITGVLLVVYSRTVSRPRIADDVYNLQEGLLDEIADNSDFRDEIVRFERHTETSMAEITAFIQDRTPSGFLFEVRVCEVEEICQLEAYLGEEGQAVYSTERIISSTLEEYNPKKLKIFMWKE